MIKEDWDLIIVGAGAAGLTAGTYGARSGLNTLLLDMKIPGGLISEAALVENYPGFPEGINGSELATKMVDQCEKAGAEIHSPEKAVDFELEGKKITLKTEEKNYTTNSLIIATGSKHKSLGVRGEKRFLGRGVSYCAVCDGPLFKDKDLIVVGGGNCAAINALFLCNLASSVKLVHRRQELRAEKALVLDMEKNGVEFFLETEVKEIQGRDKVDRVILINNITEKELEIETEGVFIEVGEVPNNEIAITAGVKVDGEGYIVVDARQRTNFTGVYAAGDITTCPHKQVGTAVGQGTIAAMEAFGYVKRPYYYQE